MSTDLLTGRMSSTCYTLRSVEETETDSLPTGCQYGERNTMATNYTRLSKRGTLCCLLTVTLGVSVAIAQDFAGPSSRTAAAGNTSSIERDRVQKVLREGSKIENEIGHFETTGDRATFHTADGKHSFDSLENLNLERIVRALSDKPEKLQWSIDGIVTEYQGRNFLQVTRAMLKSKTNDRNDRRGRSRLTSRSSR